MLNFGYKNNGHSLIYNKEFTMIELYGDCPLCGQYIMIPNMSSYEHCPSCLKKIIIYNGNFLTEDEYNNGEKLIYFIEEITERVIQYIIEGEYKSWISSRTEGKKTENQIKQSINKYGGIGTNPMLHIKFYQEYIQKTDDGNFQCKLCQFIGEIPRSKEKVKNHLINNHLTKISLINSKIKEDKSRKPIRQYLKPWQDPESLFCDTKFLKQFLGKEPAKGSECKD